MKKWSKCLFVILLLFIVTPKAVDAFSGPYSYDINEVKLSGNNLVFNGWVAINDKNNNQMHNINPIYTLTLVGKDNNGNPITESSAPYINKTASSRKTFEQLGAPDARPRDYTKAYFMKVTEAYPNTFTSDRGRVVKETEGQNFFYINIDFSFEVPLNDIIEMLDKAPRVYFKLKVETIAKNGLKVFGDYYFNTTHEIKTIEIGVQEDRVAAVADQIKTKLEEENTNIVLKFNNTLTQLATLINYGFVQGSPSGFLGSSQYRLVYKDGMIIKRPPGNDFTNLYYYNYDTHGKSQGTYTIEDKKVLKDHDPSGETSYFYYTIKIKTGGACYYGICALDGGNTTAYLPAFWTKPIPGIGIYITKENNDNPPPLPPEDPCKSLAPDKQYCCYHPDDKEVCDPDTDEEPESKSGTCKTAGETTIDFIYPKNGWGKTVLTNEACAISCKEELKVTFQPDVSVRAGMGFGYPVEIDSSRYCTADYDNENWKVKVDAAATAANKAYDNMVNAINIAKSYDTQCGTMRTLSATPVCSSPYTDYRSGMTCGCYSCRTCWDTCCDTCTGTSCSGTPPVCSEYSYTCCSSCNPHPCGGTTGASCPSQTYRGVYHSLSYNSSTDRCEKQVCNNSGETWSTAQARISGYLSQAASYRSQYNTYVNRINKLNNDRNTCDNYIANNKYTGASSTKVSVSVPNQTSYTMTSSSFSEDNAYESAREVILTTYPIYICNSHYYTSPTLVGDYKTTASSFSSNYCDYKTSPQTYKDFWNKKSDANLMYEFSTPYWVQRYTGALKTSSASGYDYDGHYAYTDFYEMSGLHDFTLNMTKLGPNLPGVSNNLWSVNPFTCQYNVNNLIFPPEGDPNNAKYGNVAFWYRQISLVDPFPGRAPGDNWSGRVQLVTSKNYKIYSETPLYIINLTPNVMQNIRAYGTNYGSYFISDPNRSLIVENYINSGIIVKGK